MSEIKYKRILFKISGEALAGDKGFGIESDVVAFISQEIKKIVDIGVEVAIVVGAGNIFRGMKGTSKGMDRASADYMGMIATVINSLALQDSLEKIGVTTRVSSAIEMKEVAEPYIRRRVIRHLEKGRVVIFAAGTGNPFFTTDTAAALRGVEIGADLVLKGTNVDGVYDKDPKMFTEAVKYNKISYNEVFEKNLMVMDLTSITLCRENSAKIIVFDLHKEDNLIKIIKGKDIGTLISSEE